MISVNDVARAAGVAMGFLLAVGAARADTHAAWPTGSSYGGTTVRHRIGMGALILLIMLLIGTDIRAETFYLIGGNFDYPGSWLQPDPENPRVPGAQDQIIINGQGNFTTSSNTKFVHAMTVSVAYPCGYPLMDYGVYLGAGSGLSIAEDLVIEAGTGFFEGWYDYLPGTSTATTQSVSVGHDLVVGTQGVLYILGSYTNGPPDMALPFTVGYAVSVSGTLIVEGGGGPLQTPSMTITGTGAKVRVSGYMSSTNGTLMISGGGTLQQSRSAITVGSNGFSSITVAGPGSNWTVGDGPLSIGPGGTVTIIGGGRLTAETLSMDGGTVTVTQGSTLSASTIGGTGFPVTITQGSTLDSSHIVGASVYVDASSRIIESSITVSSGGMLSQDSGILNGGSITVTDPGSQYTNSGNLILGGDAGTWAYVGANSGGTISVAGDVAVGKQGSGGIGIGSDSHMTVGGAMSICNSAFVYSEGDVYVGSTGAAAKGLTVGGNLTNDGQMYVGGTLSVVGSATLVNSGKIAAGTYDQGPGATLEVKILGPQTDPIGQINVFGTAHLDGRVVIDPPSPSAGYGRFAFLMGSSIDGIFEEFALPSPKQDIFQFDNKVNYTSRQNPAGPPGDVMDAAEYVRLVSFKQFDSRWGTDPYAFDQLTDYIIRVESNDKDPGYKHLDLLYALWDKTLLGVYPGGLNLASKGCKITSIAMALFEMNLVPDGFNPGVLYDQLKPTINEITGISKVTLKMMYFNGADPVFDTVLTQYGLQQSHPDCAGALKALQEGKPVILLVKEYADPINRKGGSHKHYVMAWDYDSTGFKVLNPGSDLPERQHYITADVMSYCTLVPLEPSTLYGTVHSNCPVEFLITAPSGKRLGYDPLTGITYNSVGSDSYETDYLILDPDDFLSEEEWAELAPYNSHTAYLENMELGPYTIQVWGTADGEWSLDFRTFMLEMNGQMFSVGGTISAGEIQTYQFDVTPEPATLSLLALGGAAVLARRKRRK